MKTSLVKLSMSKNFILSKKLNGQEAVENVSFQLN